MVALSNKMITSLGLGRILGRSERFMKDFGEEEAFDLSL